MFNIKVPFVQDGVWHLAANFIGEGGGAAIVATDAKVGGGITFFKNKFYFPGTEPPDAPHDFYLDAKGKAVAHDLAPADMRAVLPPDTHLGQPGPTDPAVGDVFASPKFMFAR